MISSCGKYQIDTIVSLIIGGIIAFPAFKMIQEAYNIMMEASPSHIDSSKVASEITSVPGVKGVHDLHIWSVAPGINMLSGHIIIENIPVKQGAQISNNVTQMLEDKYHIGHCTIQLECESCEGNNLYCSLEPQHEHGHEHDESGRQT